MHFTIFFFTCTESALSYTRNSANFQIHDPPSFPIYSKIVIFRKDCDQEKNALKMLQLKGCSLSLTSAFGWVLVLTPTACCSWFFDHTSIQTDIFYPLLDNKLLVIRNQDLIIFMCLVANKVPFTGRQAIDFFFCTYWFLS